MTEQLTPTQKKFADFRAGYGPGGPNPIGPLKLELIKQALADLDSIGVTGNSFRLDEIQARTNLYMAIAKLAANN